MEKQKHNLYQKRYLQDYLKELNSITNMEVNVGMLESLTEDERLKGIVSKKVFKDKILFHDKENLLLFFGQLLKLKNGKAYIYTTYSKEFGLLKINGLEDFNVNFNFNDEHAGLISIILRDLSNELTLDFYEEEDEYYLEVQSYGDDWSKAKILD